jgi:hypothetical protein
MAVPTSYTEESFAAYLHSLIPDLVGGLGWSVELDSYAEIVNDTLLALDVDDIAALVGRQAIGRLRAQGRYALWQAVSRAIAGNRFDYEDLSGKFTRSQIHQQVQLELATARQAAPVPRTAGPAYAVTRQPIRRPNDPYIPHE